jgi:peptidoglycan biosynthesis protein MviN/MurJ (putative lipid II flippase)
MVKDALYYYAASATTSAIAGILHLVLVPNMIGFNINSAIFFTVAGLAQLFWAVPMIKRWGKNMVLHWNSRHYNIDNNVGYDKNTRQSNYRKRRPY